MIPMIKNFLLRAPHGSSASFSQAFICTSWRDVRNDEVNVWARVMSMKPAQDPRSLLARGQTASLGTRGCFSFDVEIDSSHTSQYDCIYCAIAHRIGLIGIPARWRA